MLDKIKSKLNSIFKAQPVRASSPLFDIGFHGDEYLLSLAEHLVGKCKVFVETGSNVGSTLAYVAKNNPSLRCLSCEPDGSAFEQAKANAGKYDNVFLFHGRSQEFMDYLVERESAIFSQPCLFWLDAHGYGFEWPLKKELEFITGHLESAYILIDDFKVPGRDHFKFDTYQEQVCSYDFVKGALNPSRAYQLYYPTYKDKTSKHHPLCGWGLLVMGNENAQIPESLVDKIERAL